MATILQIELKHYIENHGLEAISQDNGIAVFQPPAMYAKFPCGQWHYIENYRQARQLFNYENAA